MRYRIWLGLLQRGHDGFAVFVERVQIRRVIHDVVRAGTFFSSRLGIVWPSARALDQVGVGADEGRVERGHIGFEHFRCVALRGQPSE